MSNSGSETRIFNRSPAFGSLARVGLSVIALSAILLLAVTHNPVGPFVTALLCLSIAPFAIATIAGAFPVLRAMGLATIALVLLPSYSVHMNWIGTDVVRQASAIMNAIDLIGLFITVLIIGSIMSISRTVLLSSLARIAVPIFAGSLVAACASFAVGRAMGMAPFDLVFLAIAPVMAGGINAGALPLSIGYAETLGLSQADTLARMLPAVVLGNFAAILLSGAFNLRLKKYPGLSEVLPENSRSPPPIRQYRVGWKSVVYAIVVLAFAHIVSKAGAHTLAMPASFVTLLIVALLQLSNVLPADLRSGLSLIYRGAVSVFTFPILFSIGLLFTPWRTLLDSITLANIATIFVLVGTLGATGHLLASRVGIPTADGTLITMTRAAMGGTGDIAMLSAAQRMDLMAFAQISTRVGGGLTMAAALFAAGLLS
jgi:Na+/citrate or Na+/malate symporter